jgi:coniferyl-aldehyde dehydrogenase
LAGTLSGGVTLNGTLLHIAQAELPFGGVGQSGQGGYHGRAGFERFSHARSVYKAGAIRPFEWLRPPYGRFARTVIKVLIKHRAL